MEYRKLKVFGSYEVRAPPTNESEHQRAQMHFPHKVVLPAVSWKRGRPKKERALSASEKYHRAGLKMANFSTDAKVGVCGAFQKPERADL